MDSDGEMEVPALMRAISHDETPSTPGGTRKLSVHIHITSILFILTKSISDPQGDGNRSTLIRPIISSIIVSETLYVECLNKMMQVSS